MMLHGPAISVTLVQGALQGGHGLSAPLGVGAWLCFDGVVRPTEEDGQGITAITALQYQAYEPMTSRELKTLAQKIAQQFDLQAIHVWHSVGAVAAGSASFRLWVGAAHRRQALDAMTCFIDTMKQDVPLWKLPIREISS